jgi:hypothetical protein
MGDAKKKFEALRALMREECDQWSKPPSDEEQATLQELLELPAVRAVRATPENLAVMGMTAKNCHENCAWYADNDPGGEWEHVFGWWMQPSALVLHSVIRRGDKYVCITPQADPAVKNDFLFIPDDAITPEKADDHYLLLRNGVSHHPGLRLDPQATIEYMAKVKERLSTKMNPYHAWQIDYLGAQFDEPQPR